MGPLSGSRELWGGGDARPNTQTRIISSGRFPKSVSWLEMELPVTVSAESGNKDTELTELLLSWGRGDDLAQQKLVPLVYEELRKVAHRYMRWERPGHTLQTTALVHETYLRLLESRRVRWRNRSHFMAVSAQLMRRILVDFARSKRALKRGGDSPRVTLDEELHQAAAPALDFEALDDALTALSAFDARKARVVELRFFGGLSSEETARALEVSADTVRRDWKIARAWLLRELSSDGFSLMIDATARKRWERMEKIFHRVADKTATERTKHLDGACAGDEALRREVESLLAYRDMSSSFLTASALELVADTRGHDVSRQPFPDVLTAIFDSDLGTDGLDRLRITTPQGGIKTMTLDEEPISVGRAETNLLSFPKMTACPASTFSWSHMKAAGWHETWEARTALS